MPSEHILSLELIDRLTYTPELDLGENNSKHAPATAEVTQSSRVGQLINGADINVLPPEILLLILDLLDFQDLSRLSRTSRRANATVENLCGV